MKAKMVMPAIYQFEILDHPKESKWGWHKISELIETIQNLLRSKDTLLISEKLNNHWPSDFFLWLDCDGHISSRFLKFDDWFGYLGVSDDEFIPARIGMRLINAAKHPTWASVKSFLDGVDKPPSPPRW